jgi:hypothetical protein
VTVLEAVELDLRNFATVSAESQRVQQAIHQAKLTVLVHHPLSDLSVRVARLANSVIEKTAQLLGNAE